MHMCMHTCSVSVCRGLRGSSRQCGAQPLQAVFGVSVVHALTMIVRSKKTQYFYTCIRYDCLSGFWTRGTIQGPHKNRDRLSASPPQYLSQDSRFIDRGARRPARRRARGGRRPARRKRTKRAKNESTPAPHRARPRRDPGPPWPERRFGGRGERGSANGEMRSYIEMIERICVKKTTLPINYALVHCTV